MRTAEQAMSDYQFYKSRGICPKCGKEKAATGRVFCLNCRDKESVLNIARWDSMTEEQKEQVRSRARQSGRVLYKQRKAAGLCVRCGKPAEKGHVHCYECRIKHNNRIRRDRNRKANAKAPGTCSWCSNPVKPGFKLCEAHYNRQAEILKRARSSSAVKESVAVLWKMIKMPRRKELTK